MSNGITVTRRGVEEVAGRLARLQDFKAMARQPVQSALDVVEGKQKAGIKRGQTGKAQGSVGTHIHTAKWGVYGNSGLRGGRFGVGAVAAIMLDQGTGLFGAHHALITAGKRHINAGKFRRTAHAAILGAMQADHTPGRGQRSKYKAATNANPNFMVGGVMTFAAYGSSVGAGSLFGSRFGAGKSPTTSRGKYKQQRYGAAGKVFTRSSRGMPAQPWSRDAATMSRRPAEDAFAEALNRNIAEAQRA